MLSKELKAFVDENYDSAWEMVGEAVAWLGIVALIVMATVVWG